LLTDCRSPTGVPGRQQDPSGGGTTAEKSAPAPDIALLFNDSFIDADHTIDRKIHMRQIENPVTLLGYLYDEM
jgi:hypothetical protein